MLRTLLALALCAGLCVAVLARGRPDVPFRDITFEQAKAAAESEKKVVLIDFFTTWCGPCKKLDAETWKDANVQEWLSAHCVPLKLDAEEERDLAAKYHIDAYPTILLLKPDGTQIDRLVGFKEPKEFLAASNDSLAGKDSLARAREKLVGHEDDPSARQELAGELAGAGLYEEALKEYLRCFDEGKSSLGYGGVRRSFLLSYIVQLGRHYPPAIKALEARRDVAEEHVREGSSEFDDLADAVALNRELGASQRSISLLDDLKKAGPIPSRARLSLFLTLEEQLFNAKRYSDMVALLDGPTKFVEGQIRAYRLAASFRAANKDQKAGVSDADSFLKAHTIVTGARVYEALLATKRGEDADSVANSLIEFERTGKTLATLIEAAGRQADLERAKSLGERGLRELPEKDRTVVQRALDKAVKPDKAK